MKMINLRIVLLMTVLTGGIYPIAMTALGQLCFPHEVNGSLMKSPDGRAIGSELIAQPVTSPRYFHPRPSAGGYATMPSGASNQSPTSKALWASVQERIAAVVRDNSLSAETRMRDLPTDLLFASGSGLDPHISPAAAYLQALRVASEREIPMERIRELIRNYTDLGGLFGQPAVNVMLLNRALDNLK